MKSLIFYSKNTWFNIQEQFSDLPSVFAESLLIPFFIWLITQLWQFFNANQGNFTRIEIILYVAITETLYLTFLRSSSFTRASADFSIALARPRSWLVMSFTGIFGRSFGLRLIYIFIMAILMIFFNIPLKESISVWLKLLLFLPFLGIFQSLINLLFASLQVLWQEVGYFALPVGKIFLSLGGVFGPLLDFKEPFRSILLNLPPSDLFFQPAYFCIKGNFYNLNTFDWCYRMLSYCTILIFFNIILFQFCKKQHQSYGG